MCPLGVPRRDVTVRGSVLSFRCSHISFLREPRGALGHSQRHEKYPGCAVRYLKHALYQNGNARSASGMLYQPELAMHLAAAPGQKHKSTGTEAREVPLGHRILLVDEVDGGSTSKLAYTRYTVTFNNQRLSHGLYGAMSEVTWKGAARREFASELVSCACHWMASVGLPRGSQENWKGAAGDNTGQAEMRAGGQAALRGWFLRVAGSASTGIHNPFSSSLGEALVRVCHRRRHPETATRHIIHNALQHGGEALAQLRKVQQASRRQGSDPSSRASKQCGSAGLR
ncbi:hypothetical protein JB92DRAFT_2829834 [Gautieria morchelliformis]|nr:hypothetical protein JB92DRAFT_2829834 [Gautieria morchelliformis]